MNLVRKHKISIINNEPLTGTDKEIIDFLEDKLSNLVRFEHCDFPNYVFYMKDFSVLLEHLSKPYHNFLYCNKLWKELMVKYNMTDDDIQYIIKYMLEQSIKIKRIPFNHYHYTYGTVERYFRETISMLDENKIITGIKVEDNPFKLIIY